MRLLVVLILSMLWSSMTQANDINISTINKDGNTVFFLQAGAFNLEKDALQRKAALTALVKEPIEIKILLINIFIWCKSAQSMNIKTRESLKTDCRKKL